MEIICDAFCLKVQKQQQQQQQKHAMIEKTAAERKS
jgi:hypothetical protein